MRKRVPFNLQHNDRAATTSVPETGFAALPVGTVRQSNLGLFSKALLAASMLVIGSVSSEAGLTYSFTPADSDLGDLDHHYAYMWVLKGLDTTQTYTSASLKISNINNWDLTKNILFIHLFDTAYTSPSGVDIVGSGNNIVTSFADASGVPVTTLKDAFGASSLSSNPLVKQSNKQNVLLGTYVDGSFAGAGSVIDGVSVPNYGNGAYTPPATPNLPQTVTYNFDAFQLGKLNAYIKGGDMGRIAFGFDSDCHFFNDGITFTMSSDVALSAIPEPASTLTGLACLAPILGSMLSRRRRSSAARDSK